MKFLKAITAAILTGIIGFIAALNFSGLYIEIFTETPPGDLAGLSALLLSLLTFPILTLILIFIFIKKYDQVNIPGIIFGGITGLWLTGAVNHFLTFTAFHQQLNNNFALLFRENIGILLFAFLILGYIFVRKSASWLHINGFTVGTVLGFFTSCGIVILMRAMTNSLTSFFYFDSNEEIIVLLLVFIGAIAGNAVGKRRSRAGRGSQ